MGSRIRIIPPSVVAMAAATRAGALDETGREALLRYVLRPPIAQERVQPQSNGLVRIALKRAYADGTFAVDMDPLSLLFRLATSVPPPRFHTVKYAGVLAPASPWRAQIAPRKSAGEPGACADRATKECRSGRRRSARESRGVQAPQTCANLSTLGGAPPAHVRRRRPRVPEVQGPDEAYRDGNG